MSSRRARHRAPVARFAWASRALLTAATVPVGALAGCAVAAASSSADRPEVGLAGLVLAGVPLGVHSWRQRGVRAPVRGRHASGVAGVADLWPVAAVTGAPVVGAPAAVPATAMVTSPVTAPVTAMVTAPVVVPAPGLVPRQRTAAVRTAATREAAPTRVFTVSASQQVVEVGPGRPRDVEIAELQRIWDAGTGPDTGVLVPVPALPDVPALPGVLVAVAGDVRRLHAA